MKGEPTPRGEGAGNWAGLGAGLAPALGCRWLGGDWSSAPPPGCGDIAPPAPAPEPENFSPAPSCSIGSGDGGLSSSVWEVRRDSAASSTYLNRKALNPRMGSRSLSTLVWSNMDRDPSLIATKPSALKWTSTQ